MRQRNIPVTLLSTYIYICRERERERGEREREGKCILIYIYKNMVFNICTYTYNVYVTLGVD